MAPAEHEDIYKRLDTLAGYDTVSSFAQAFYELIAEYALGEGLQAQWLRNRLAEYLDIEARYHWALAALASNQVTSLGDLRSATEKRQIGLQSLVEQLGKPALVPPTEGGRLLLSAECYYQLGLTDRVVERLECAIEGGAKHPLIQFALGYNRYLMAVQAFTAYCATSGTRQIIDEARFRAACLRAVGAFQEGLTSEGFDSQLYWWIGTVLEAVGFSEAAAASFEKANEMMGEEESVQESGDDSRFGLDFGADYEYEGQERSGPITEDEVQEAARLLQRTHRASDLRE